MYLSNGNSLPPKGILLPPNGILLPPKGILLPPKGILLPPKGILLLPKGNLLLPKGILLPPNGILLPPKGNTWNQSSHTSSLPPSFRVLEQSEKNWHSPTGLRSNKKSRIEMQLLLRIFRFCNPQRKHRKPSTYVQLPGVGCKRGKGSYYFADRIIIFFKKLSRIKSMSGCFKFIPSFYINSTYSNADRNHSPIRWHYTICFV